jgi:DNA-binding PucR family transcriptional regulator
MTHVPQDPVDSLVRKLRPTAPDPLARATAVVRETLKCCLDNDRNITATSERLHVAKSTVNYRVDKAERLRGRPVGDRRLQLHTALHLVERLGPMVLRPPPAGR